MFFKKTALTAARVTTARLRPMTRSTPERLAICAFRGRKPPRVGFCCRAPRVKSPSAENSDQCFRNALRLYSKRRGVISRMFPAAESAFIITAPETTLASSPSLFLVAAALNSE